MSNTCYSHCSILNSIRFEAVPVDCPLMFAWKLTGVPEADQAVSACDSRQPYRFCNRQFVIPRIIVATNKLKEKQPVKKLF